MGEHIFGHRRDIRTPAPLARKIGPRSGAGAWRRAFFFWGPKHPVSRLAFAG